MSKVEGHAEVERGSEEPRGQTYHTTTMVMPYISIVDS